MVIAGGGPTGLMLAAELTLAGIDVVVVERRASQDLDGSRAGGLHARTIEVLDQRGVASGSSPRARPHPVVGYADIPLDISDFPTRHNYVLALWQSDIERILAGWVDELGVPILRGREVVGLRAGRRRASTSSCPTARRCERRYLVGCDGGRSLVRKAAGIEFPGLDPSTSWIIAEVEMDEEPEIGTRREGGGIGPVNRAEGGGPYGVVLREDGTSSTTASRRSRTCARRSSPSTAPTSGCTAPTWISRFTDVSRQAASYRDGRVLLAGDAAHVHPPAGRPGPQHRRAGRGEPRAGSWPRWSTGPRPSSLLDTYHDERHPVGARVLHNTMAQVALGRTDDRTRPSATRWPSCSPWTSRAGASPAMISGLDIHYDLGEGHPLLGRRMPDLDLQTADGPHAGLRAAARRPARAAQPRRARRLRHRAVGRSGPGGRRHLRRRVGAPGHRRGRRAPGRADPPRRPRRLDGRPHRPRAAARALDLVRSSQSDGLARRSSTC